MFSALDSPVTRSRKPSHNLQVLNGGVVIRNWQQIVGKSVWEAYAPSLAGTRQLYVNQQRRNRASSPATLLGETTIVTDGYSISNPKLGSWY